MNIFRLLEVASLRLKTNDALFHEQADTVLGILRSAGVLPHKRSSLNGSLHKLVAAMIVQAYDDNTTIDVAVRRAGTFHHYGYSRVNWTGSDVILDVAAAPPLNQASEFSNTTSYSLGLGLRLNEATSASLTYSWEKGTNPGGASTSPFTMSNGSETLSLGCNIKLG